MADQPVTACGVSEEQLWSWFDQQSPQLASHLKQCPRCRELAAQHEHNVEQLRAGRPTVDESSNGDAGGDGGRTRISGGRGSGGSSGDGAAGGGGRYQPGDQIGPYTILQKIGEGGFANVYLAQQEKPFRKRVALKIIKRGMDSDQVIARFEAERQALAVMDHPNVARVLDGGLTEAGRPYFTMEFVPGEPITDYCDKHRLSNTQRLDLFIQVCEAVQHAHHKGIIHRDLKPSNVLVTLPKDRKPEVRVIDFGVAKAMNRELSEKAIFTEIGQIIGTPEYMSPEQAEMTGLDIDTRTDVYSLGVLLYELVVGALPFDPRTLRSRAFHEIARIIREEEPPKPSTKLSSLGERSREVAEKHHHATIRALEMELRGDLDWITMMAMEKDRTRRYDTPSELAADVRRYLQDKPVIASPPSVKYRVRKFVRRNKGLVVGTGAVAAALVLGMVGTTTGMVAAQNARADAEVARDDAVSAQAVAVEERDRAVEANEWSQRLARHFIGEFHDAIAELPGTLKTRNRLAEEAEAFLTSYLEELERDGEDAIEVKLDMAWVHRRIGQILGGIRGPNQNRRAEAREHFEAAIQLCEDVVEEAPANREARLALASSHVILGDLSPRIDARDRYERAMEMCRELYEEDPEPKAQRMLAVALLEMGDTYHRAKAYDEAEPYFVESLEHRRQLADRDEPGKTAQRDLSVGLNRMVALRKKQVRLAEAERFAEEFQQVRESELDGFKESTRRRRDLMQAYQILGDLYGHAEVGQSARAMDMFRDAVVFAEDLHRQDPDDQRARFDYADVLWRAGNASFNLGNAEDDVELKHRGLELNRQSKVMLESIIDDFPADRRAPRTLKQVQANINAIQEALAGGE